MTTFLVLSSLCVPSQIARGESLSLKDFLRVVEENHPERLLSEGTASVADARAGRTGWWPDPALDYEMAEGSKTLRLTQSIPFPGTLWAASDSAKAAGRLEHSRARRLAEERRWEAELLYWDLVGKERELEIARHNREQAHRLLAIAESRVKHGTGSVRDLAAARAEATIAASRARDIESENDNLRDLAAFAMGKASLAGTRLSDTFKLESPSSTESDLVREETMADFDRRQYDVSREIRQNLPRFTLGGERMEEEGKMPMYSTMIGVSVPVWSLGAQAYLWAERSRLAALRENTLSLQDKRRALALRLNDRRMERLSAHVRSLEQELVPVARGQLSSTANEYAQGRQDFLAVNAARTNLYRMETSLLAAWRAHAAGRIDRLKVQAGLVDAESGRSIEAMTQDSMSAPTMTGPSMGSSMTRGSRKSPARPEQGPAPMEEEPATSGSSGGMSM